MEHRAFTLDHVSSPSPLPQNALQSEQVGASLLREKGGGASKVNEACILASFWLPPRARESPKGFELGVHLAHTLSPRLLLSLPSAASMSNPNDNQPTDIESASPPPAPDETVTAAQSSVFIAKAMSKRLQYQQAAARDTAKIVANRDKIGGSRAMDELVQEHQQMVDDSSANYNQSQP